MEKLVYLIDDHEMFMIGLESCIQKHFNNVKTNNFLDPELLYQAVKDNKPDLLIADFMLANGNIGLEIIHRTRAIHPNIKSVIISSAKEDKIKDLCREKGIQGYIYKSETESMIAKALAKVLAGGTYFTEESEEKDIQIEKNYDKSNPFSKLTKRELEVVVYLSKGLSYAEISKTMNISARTVNNHRVNITEKIGKMSLQHLIMKASIWGVVNDRNIYSDFENKVSDG